MTSSAKRKQSYRDYAAYGNLAYDLDAAERDSLRTQRRERPRVRSIEREDIRPRQQEKVSPFAIAGFAVAAVMMVFMLMSYIQLNAISDATVELRSELAKLESQNVTLTADYQKAFDLDAVEAAAEEAGMVKAGSSQVYYIDMSEPDSAVVYQNEDSTVLSGIAASMSKGIYAFVEYFR